MKYKILISIFLVSFASFLVLVKVNNDQRHDMKSSIHQLKEETETLESHNILLETRLDQSIFKNAYLIKQNDSLNTEINELYKELHVTEEIKPVGVGLSKYLVRVYSFNPLDQVIKEMDVYLYGEGYNMLIGKKYITKPDWMANKPTVYYHAESAKPIAEKIALDLEEITDVKFKVKRGSGNEVNVGQEKYTIFIHYAG